MRLVDVYSDAESFMWRLYELLKERTPEESISHSELPKWHDHVEFVLSNPYEAWYAIEVVGYMVGAIYLTKQREIGVFLFKVYQNQKYGKQAVKMLMENHPGPYLANVNPKNERSRKLWESLGGEVIQHTYRVPA